MGGAGDGGSPDESAAKGDDVQSAIRILVVDDHALLRDTLIDVLQREPGFKVVGSAETADKAVEALRTCEPDVILMDVDMPGGSSFNAARTIQWMRPDARIVFLSAFSHDRYIEQALAAKARGYATKSEPPETIIRAIREVAAGGVYFSPQVKSRLVFEPRATRMSEAPAGSSRAASLTSREIEVLRHLSQGHSKKDIAIMMNLSVKTVDRHAANLMSKLDIHDRVELARFAIREGYAQA